MKEQYSADVLICGAGAAGLMLAIELARRDISFRLIEKLDKPFAGSRGKGIQPRTQEIFEDIGILDQLFATGGLYPSVRSYAEDGTYIDREFIERGTLTSAEPYQLPLMVPQFLTERVMRDRLAELGHHVEFGYELVSFNQDAKGVTVRVAGASVEENFRVRWLVGTDGGRSAVRQALGVDFPGKTLGVRAIVADVTLTGLTRDVWHQFNDNDMQRQIFFCPLAGTELFQIQGPISLQGDIDLSVDGLNALVAKRTGRQDIQIQDVSWASAYQMNARLAERYRVDRVFLVGDAAHIHPPTGGQGLNTSVQDAYNLGWKLAAVINGAPDKLLDTYEEERRPVAAEMLGLSVKLLDAQKQGGMKRGREVHQLDIGYPNSSLSLPLQEGVSKLLPGDRAPDAALRGAAGQSQRLFELFRGTHWTLLGNEVDRKLIHPRSGLHIHILGKHGDLIDDQSHFRQAYDLPSGSWLLVRPDGYVSAIVYSGAINVLEEYFKQTFIELKTDG